MIFIQIINDEFKGKFSCGSFLSKLQYIYYPIKTSSGKKDGTMKNNPSSRGLLLYPALLSIWLAISCAALFYADIKTAMAGTLIMAAVAVASLAVVTGVLVWGVSVITIVVYGIMIYVLYGVSPSTILVFITFSTAATGTALLGWNTSKQFLSANRQVERDRVLIEEMRINDQKTGLMRFHYARRALSNEISRSLRYGKKLSLLLIKINNWEELAEKIGLDTRENLLKEICEVLLNNCRNVDTLFINIDKIGVILPETGNDGAQIIAQRLADQVKKKTKEELRIGIAGFPDDSIVDDDLINKAEIALMDSIRNRTEIVFYKLSPITTDFPGQNVDSGVAADDILGLQLNSEDVESLKKIKTGETAIRFNGVCTLSDIEFLRKSLENVPEIGTIRLIDFAENEIVFAVESDNRTLAERLLTKLDIPNISIEEKPDSIDVKLDPTFRLK